MMGWSSRCYIPSVLKIGLPVLKKKIFEGFLPNMGVTAILVRWPASCHQIFIPLNLEAFIKNLVQIGKVLTGCNNLNCLHLPTFRSQAAIVSENPLFSLFPIEKPKLPNLTLP